MVVPFVASFPRHALAEDGQGGREQVKILLRDASKVTLVPRLFFGRD